jgi:hypothetical protein
VPQQQPLAALAAGLPTWQTPNTKPQPQSAAANRYWYMEKLLELESCRRNRAAASRPKGQVDLQQTGTQVRTQRQRAKAIRRAGN